jgi:ribonuclease P/MRP protein subunit POP1
MATIGLEGVETSIIGLLRGLHFAEDDGDRPWLERGIGKKWRDGTRVWEGWIQEREGNVPKKIAEIAVVWSTQESPDDRKRKAFIRVHPSAFLHLWNQIIRMAKVQKPAVTVEDLRFEIGSIEIMGPAAAETLCSILVANPQGSPSSVGVESLWPTLASISDCRIMPPNPVLAFSCSDPRLRDPPQTASISQNTDIQSQLMETLASWPIDKSKDSPGIFSRNQRLAAGRSLASQQSINRRRSAAAPGQYPEARSTDPQIPMLTYVSTTRKTWTVLLPWKCVVPFWRGITRYPVSTGGNPRFGGLDQIRQVSYEHSRPCFPFDFPGTSAGWAWELRERVTREKEWTKRPKGKRVEWTTLDLVSGKKGELGDPWACDWERLLPPSSKDAAEPKKFPNPTASPFQQLLSKKASDWIAGRNATKDCLTVPQLFTVKISMVQRGVPTNCARIYRLPTTDPRLRDRWLALGTSRKPTGSSKHATGRGRTPNAKAEHLPKHLQARALASSLLEPSGRSNSHPQVGDDGYPRVPDEEDLIGFVTTGNYNLAEGKPTAIANLALHKVMQSRDDEHGGTKEAKLCIIREVGEAFGRLATWEVV